MTHPVSLWRAGWVASWLSPKQPLPKAAGLSNEEITSRLASKLSGVGRKLAGTGSPSGQNGGGEVESDGDHGLVTEAKAEKARLPRWS